MKYTNLEYQSQVLNRLANMAFRKGGINAMRESLDKATAKIWQSLDSVYGRSPEVTRQGYNMRLTV